MPELITPGEVWLVGAGPGDPDLLTRKAERLLAAADVVFHDALVGPAILALIPANVVRVPVGKRAGHHSQSQPAINELLVRAALAGKRIVRLKGGDPSIFGRSAEEIDALAAHGIACRICPGITTASAAAASAMVSLTLRGVARQVRFLTAQSCDDQTSGPDWAALADPATTLAVYMGRSAAAGIARNLMAHGLSGATPVLVASNVSLPDEAIVGTRLDLLRLVIDKTQGAAPALILIGEAMGLRQSGDMKSPSLMSSHAET
jgi:uroporphyrin-III C-methyltransferase